MHLSSVVVSHGYPLSPMQKITKTRTQSTSAEPTTEYKSTAVLPYDKAYPKNLSASYNKAYQPFSSQRLQ